MDKKSSISSWLRQAATQLKDISVASARLDAELLLAETLRKPRTYLHAHPDEALDPRRRDIADARLSLRLDRLPLAYISGYQGFFRTKFTVSPAVLVPRPASETMISLLLELQPTDTAPKTLIDVGTGSGCLGITAALELPPRWHVILSDISQKALDLATRNAEQLGTNVFLQKQSLLAGQIKPVDVILANLPYVDAAWNDLSPELRHEPQRRCTPTRVVPAHSPADCTAPSHMRPGGLLLLEADEEQHQTIIGFGKNYRLGTSQPGCIVALEFVGAER